MSTPLKLVAEETAAVTSNEEMEIDLLLMGIRSRYGYDFTHYSRASLKRRLERAMAQARVGDYTELLDRLLHDETTFDEFLVHMSVTVTSMFRDPAFYRAIREHVLPVFRTYPFVKIWHAGCATGEEVYSMAILLHEEGFLDRTRIYATDFNKQALDVAEKGVYPAKNMALYAEQYQEAGGKGYFPDYYSRAYDLIKMKDFLKERITFSYHNLVTDGIFGEMNLICCRNVMIYFDKVLQDQVLVKFTEGLCHKGFLGLGNKESLNFSSVKGCFETVNKQQRLYCKRGDFHEV